MNKRQTHHLSLAIIAAALFLIAGMLLLAHRSLHASQSLPIRSADPAQRFPYQKPSSEGSFIERLNPLDASALSAHQTEVSEILKASGPKICLTFDDGPNPNVTPKLLDLLKQYHVHATFFVVGQNAERYPDLLKRMTEEGHEIGNHSYDHSQLTKLSVEKMMNQIDRTNEIVAAATGVTPKYLRPPYGSKNQVMKDTVPMPFILWNVDPNDWKKTATKESIADNVLAHVSDGGIVLSHDLYERTYEAYGAILPQLAKQGYQFLTVSEMFGAQEVPAVNGEPYFTIKP